MDETSLDYTLLKMSREDNLSVCKSSGSLGRESRVSMKRSTFYVVLVGVSICLVGSYILVYLLSSNKNTCQCTIPDGWIEKLNAKANTSQNVPAGVTLPLVNKQTTLPRSTQTTTSKVITTNKLTTKKSTTDGTSASVVTSAPSQKTTARKQDCDDKWFSYGGSCYMFSNQSVVWMEAMMRCRNLNAHLVEITSVEESQFLRNQAAELSRLHKKECYEVNPAKYKGNKSTTYDGHTCQRWDSQTPHKHSRNRAYRFPDVSLYEAANHCRDPDSSEPLTWCYTTDPKIRWRYCDIYKCPGGNYWIGLVALEDKWTWINSQTELGQGYSNWGQKQSPLTITCGSAVGAIDFQWESKTCTFPTMYICEK